MFARLFAWHSLHLHDMLCILISFSLSLFWLVKVCSSSHSLIISNSLSFSQPLALYWVVAHISHDKAHGMSMALDIVFMEVE